MNPRTPYALMVAGLFLATGAVTADDASPTAANTATAASPGFELAIAQHEAWTKPGAPFTFALKAYARGAETLTLSVRAPDGVRYELAPDVLRLAAGEGARATLTVAASEPAREGYPIVVTATDEDGNERSVRAILRVVAAEPKPYAEDVHERRFQAIVERLERIERYLGLDRADKPRPTPAVPPQAPGLRAVLATPDAVVGPEGARIALLLQAGDGDVRAPIAIRADEASGWKIALEKDAISLGAHERTWLWVHLVPGDGAAPLKYAIIVKDPQGIVLAEGSATQSMP